MTADFSSQTMQPRKQGSNLFKELNKTKQNKTVNLEFCIQKKTFFKSEVIHIFFRHSKADRIHHQKTNTTTNVKESPSLRRIKVPNENFALQKKNLSQERYKKLEQHTNQLYKLIFIEHSTQQHQNTHLFLVYLEHLPRQTIC